MFKKSICYLMIKYPFAEVLFFMAIHWCFIILIHWYCWRHLQFSSCSNYWFSLKAFIFLLFTPFLHKFYWSIEWILSHTKRMTLSFLEKDKIFLSCTISEIKLIQVSRYSIDQYRILNRVDMLRVKWVK